ncbi:12034_t:CDS:2 [Cetraspora pellucida]|uniref:12034_t:CDS:1 n=1 Tax=Cetraspora pellucida TaxID=1433469 RepID=A0A9N9BZ90_9GLOM|nr:12034_t:CDS:2 [Cetraspora pellucida]
MSDDPTASVSIIQDNITNKSNKPYLEGLQPDSPIVSESTDTLLSNLYLIFENIEDSKSNLVLFENNINLTQFGLTSNIIVESDSDNKHKTQLDLLNINLNNYKNETNNSISLEDKMENYISTEYDDENTKYKSNLTTNFLICIESDPNNILCLLLAALIII